MSKAKGGRTRRKIEDYYRALGYEVACVEKGGSRYIKNRDLFSDKSYSDSGFDSIAVANNCVTLIQCKSNRPATQAFYKEFAKKYAGEALQVIVATLIDRKGCRFQNYTNTGKIEEEFVSITKINSTIKEYKA